MASRGFEDVAGRRLSSTLNVPLFCQQCGGNTLYVSAVHLMNMAHHRRPGTVDASACDSGGSLLMDETVTDGVSAIVELRCRTCPLALGTGLAVQVHAEDGVMRVIVAEERDARKDD